jgi:hypothetical protein
VSEGIGVGVVYHYTSGTTCRRYQAPHIETVGQTKYPDVSGRARRVHQRDRGKVSTGKRNCRTSRKFNLFVDPPVLESLVELGQFGVEVTKVDLVTDTLLRTWLDKHQDIKKDGLSAAQVQTIVNRSRLINMAERDCEQRIIMLLADYKSLLRLNGMAWLVDENPKLAVSHITDALKPSVLRKRIKDNLLSGHIGLKNDFLLFMKHVISRAERYADYEEPDETSSGNIPKLLGARPEKLGPMAGSTSETKAQAHPGIQVKTHPGVKNKGPHDCLNPKCSLKHYLKECANTTPALKDELYAELAERRKKWRVENN